MEQRDFNDIKRRQADAERTFDLHTEMLKEQSRILETHTKKFQELSHMLIAQRTDILFLQNNVTTLQDDAETLKTEMREARADIIAIKATQSDHGELLKESAERLGKIETTMATKDDIADIKATQDLILQLLQQKPGE